MKSNIAYLYEELRKATDGGSESMTHDDALKQIAYWQNKEQAQAVEPVGVFDIAVTEKMAVIDYDCTKHSLKSGDKLYTHPAPPATGEHAELIAKLRSIESRHLKIEGKVPLEMLDFYIAATLGLHHAANMLEADAQEIATTERQVEILSDELAKCSKQAQQVAVPMTEDEILNLQYLDGGFDLIKFARAIEKHHGIGAKQ